MTDEPNISRVTLEDNKRELDSWMTKVKKVADRHTPTTNYKIRPCPRPSRETQIDVTHSYDSLSLKREKNPS